MANICDNRFYFTCDKNFNSWEEKIANLFETNLEGGIDYTDNWGDDGGIIEGWFNSRWSFPTELFEDLIPNQENDPDEVYFRCLSEEYGCGYVAMNIYRDGEWYDEQTFEL